MFIGLLPVAEEVADVDEGQGDAEPHGAHAQHGGEGNGAGGVLAPDEKVDKNAHGEHQAGIQGGREKCGRLQKTCKFLEWSNWLVPHFSKLCLGSVNC